LARKHSIASHKPSNSNMLYLNKAHNDDFQIYNNDSIINQNLTQIDKMCDDV